MKKLIGAILASVSLLACAPLEETSTSSSSTANYYVSASGCSGASGVSYNGTNASTCQYYHEAALAAQCTKILWKCN
jgi:hypothetical protein